MEDTLRGIVKSAYPSLESGLNPCFNGRYSQSATSVQSEGAVGSLNPCFNGRYSQRSLQFLELQTLSS